MKERKIAIVYHVFPSYRDGIIKELARKSDDIYFFSGNNSVDKIKTFDFISENLESRWFRVINIWMPLGLLFQFGFFGKIFDKEYKKFIFLGNPNFVSTWVAILLIKLAGKKVYLWTHGFVRDNDSLKEKIRRKFFKLADGLLLYGENSYNDLVGVGFEEKKLHVIYNSLDYASQYKVRNRIDIGAKENVKLFKNTEVVLVYLGRLNLHKKLEWVVRVVSDLRMKGIMASALFIGDGPARNMITSLSNKYNISEFVYITGAIYEEEKIGELLSYCDVCLSPAEIGLTAMHVMAYGIPVVTHSDDKNQMPEFESVIDGETGLLFKNNDYSDLILKMEHFCLDKRLKKNGKYKSFCIKKIEEKYNSENQANLLLKAICESENV